MVKYKLIFFKASSLASTSSLLKVSNTAMLLWPVGDRIIRVPLFMRQWTVITADSNRKYLLNYLIFVLLVTRLSYVKVVEKYFT